MALSVAERLKQVPLTPSQNILLKCLINPQNGKPGPRPTLDEVYEKYSKLTGKKKGKKSSITTSISQMRKVFEEHNFPFPSQWELKREGGGGRSVQRVDAVEALNGILGGDFDLETIQVDDNSEEATAEI